MVEAKDEGARKRRGILVGERGRGWGENFLRIPPPPSTPSPLVTGYDFANFPRV